MKIACENCGNPSEFTKEETNRICSFCGTQINVQPLAWPALQRRRPATMPQSQPKTPGLVVAGFAISMIGLIVGFLTCGMLGVPGAVLCMLGCALCGLKIKQEPRGLAIGGIVLSAVGLLPALFLLTIFLTRGSAAQRAERQREEDKAVERMIAEIPEETVTRESFESFRALTMVPQSNTGWDVSVSEFHANGPDHATSLPTLHKLRQVAFDSTRKRYYGITNHDFGRLSKTGEFTEIQVPASLRSKMSWSHGLAYLPHEDSLVVLVSRGALYFRQGTGEWEFVEVPGYSRSAAVTYSPSEQLYYALSLVRSEPKGTFDVVRLSSQLAVTGRVRLSHPLPIVSDGEPRIQLAMSGSRLIAVTAAQQSQPRKYVRLYSVDPHTGEVRLIKARSDEEAEGEDLPSLRPVGAVE